MLKTLEAPELVFGLCSPIGTDNPIVADLLKNTLMGFGYRTEYFKVTQLMQAVEIPTLKLVEKPLDKRYDSYIKYANELRRLFDEPSVLSMMCCAAVRSFRRSAKQSADSYLPRHAYIFDQFKRTEEIVALRQVYGRLFVLISIYSEKDKRIRQLTERISSDNAISRPGTEHEQAAHDLLKRDEDEEGIPSGQRLRDAFPLADLFINIDDIEGAKRNLHRFLSALFGSNEVSPTRDEYGMYIAKSAALRSLDLSRQVGAAIFTEQNDIVSLGCNEVPAAGGGAYWESDEGDARDYKNGRDENERIKRAILADIVRRLKSGKFIESEKSEEDLVSYVLSEAAKKGTSLREAHLMDLIEFGRVVHAEMSAISDSARLGRSTDGCTLYCTTFPCHICAKHIISAGIKRVIYIEPYPKSYTEELHRDAISIGSQKSCSKKVQFSPFIGISPFRFREIFEREKRKDSSGHFQKRTQGSPHPVIRYTVASWLQNEQAFTKIYFDKAKKLLEDSEILIQS
ncbi:deoxycytidylate deaminase [Amorphus suaedae]